ncbi:hypothetical protein BH10PSE13_BH10PSE13_00510 [soil metagenome]
MTFPVDQFVKLTQANGQFALKLAEIARAGGEDYLRIGSKAVSGLAEQARAATPGATPRADGAGGVNLLSEIEQSREATVAKTKAAFDDWQGAWKDVWSTAADSKGAIDVFQNLTQSYLKAFTVSSTETPTKPAEGQRPA